ncbi:hypothetical protein LRD69_06080 [Streptomyces sp. JH14]|uniref:hypothetical protein n=1 Tax=Streptomyces sp. JH14 TaxID=2793630 RepID=UPI0023F66ABC|nr:hypothetical protein [Streptomyces sp. JH14]MDF6041733.1 hypothetical protein [Streptomyces sp. JH14]
MARQIPSWAAVTGLTAAALAAVTALALQAGGAAPQTAATGRPAAGPSPSATADETPAAPRPPAVPADSGNGKRVVYSLGQDRAWLVDEAGKALGTFPVWPGTVDPAPGGHAVTGRLPGTTGSDGVPVEHVVYFALSGTTTIAFSAAVDNSSPKPAPGQRLGAIRLRTEDGKRLWDFATTGTRIHVVR